MKKFAIILLALGLVAAFTLPAMAEIKPYGSMRLGIFWENHDYDNNAYNPGWTNDNDDSGIMMDISDISRFGAKGTVGEIFGHIELGLIGQENATGYTAAMDNLEVYTRLIYGTWDFGGGTLTVGQDYTPITFISNQEGPGIFDDNNVQSYDLQNAFIGVGCLWDSRVPQIRLNLDNGLYVMIAQPDDPEPAGAGRTAGGDRDANLPKMMVGYDYKAEGLFISPGLAYQTIDYNDKAVGGSFDDDITAWIAFVKATLDLGAVNFKLAAHYGENLANYAISGRTNPYNGGVNAAAAYVKPDYSVEDAECWGGFIQAAFPIDPYTLRLGWGYSSSQVDNIGDPDGDGLNNTNEDELMGFFVNLKIPITDNFSATPEFDYWDGMKNEENQDDPDHWYLGILWQMDF
ncbi:MAG: porin [Deltaproteobacteria bacterium]|nr:porin [Deltaproteobacteria bacterium]